MVDPGVDGVAGVPAAKVQIVRVAEGERLDAAGIEHVFKLTGEATGGRFGLEEFVVPPATMGARPHVHQAHDEYFYVLAGELTLAGEEGEVVLAAGECAAAPRGSRHGYRNAHPQVGARVLCMYTPAGYEQYFRDVHAAHASGETVTAELLAHLRSRYATSTS